MAKVTELTVREDFDHVVEASFERPVAVLKHSIACPLSMRGQQQFLGLDDRADPPLYLVIVQYARQVSNYIEEQTGVRHETPQVLLLSEGDVVYHASHSRISTDALRTAAHEAVRQAQRTN